VGQWPFAFFLFLFSLAFSNPSALASQPFSRYHYHDNLGSPQYNGEEPCFFPKACAFLCPKVPPLLIFIPFGPSPKRQGLIIRIKTKGRDSSLSYFYFNNKNKNAEPLPNSCLCEATSRGGLLAIGAREGFYYYFFPLLLPPLLLTLQKAKAKVKTSKGKR